MSLIIIGIFSDALIHLIFQQWWDGVIQSKGYFHFLSFLPKVLLAIIIPILDNVYQEIAVWLNDMGKICFSLFTQEFSLYKLMWYKNNF